jgi:hypothetical protein
MKKIILVLVVIFASNFARAQENAFSKGNKFVEGSFSFRSGDVEDSWAFNPSLGYMLDNKWAVGGRLNFAGTDDKLNNKTSTYGITGFARYYFLTLGATKSFNVFGELGLGYSSVKNDPNVGATNTNSRLNANIDLGINYFFTNHWAATFKLANILSYNSTNPENGNNSSDLNVNVNLFNNIFAQPQFGLLYRW